MRSFFKNILVLLFLLLFLTGCGNANVNDQSQINNYTVSRTGTTNDSERSFNNNSANNNIDKVNKETDLSSFSTKIYTPDDTARQNNIKLTCSKLNGTIVKSRRNFFFLRYCWESDS